MAGIREILAAAWLRWSEEWYLLALRLTHDTADAEDAVSEALRRTLRADPELSSSRHARNYVARAIRSVVAATYEKRKRRRVLLEEFRHEHTGETQTPIDDFIAAEDAARVKDVMESALAAMTHEVRQALTLYYDPDEERTFRDVAELQEVSVRTAYKRVQSGLDLVAKAIEEDLE